MGNNYQKLNCVTTGDTIELDEHCKKNQEQHAVGDTYIKSLSKDLPKEFSDMKDFSEINIKYINRWYSIFIKRLQVVA